MALITLRELLPHANLPPQAVGRRARGLAEDSRNVQPGFVFFALSGVKANGVSFAPAALAAGACAIVCERAPQGADRSVYIEVPDARLALAQAAAIFYPRQPATTVAVTGTSGKTSVASFVRQIWSSQGRKAAAVGTTGIVTDAGIDEGALTTPDAITLHRTLQTLADQGFTHLAMEASSHGLDQRRLDGVRLAAAGFTNLSRDHLDYHPDMDSYLAAKMRLFEALLPSGRTAVIDADGDYSARVIALCKARGHTVFTTGRAGEGLRLLEAQAHADSTRIVVAHDGATRQINLPLAGAFMASNALVAAGLCIASGEPADGVLAALETLQGAPGRLEKVGERDGAPVFVDYAHKPDALEKVLAALRPMTSGRLVVVFGCGGDRDRGKRPIMGEIAVKGADVVIVTDDNPRSENPAAIRAEILKAAPGAIEIGDRASAIAHAVSLLRRGDALVIAGKGHETGQKIGASVLPFSDHGAARAALQSKAEAQ
ncbi:MAG: UDP-N-acetylmuramoyl-L-alanyl-D-glutamate--2,6-diaminopimelate ligase [Beijerinckiaceae bacterium]|nr:UDP-N-acetylmuramoyl-L-alanyl-D-glutamate--2,6-diaminopimelate ligase [Beijerinckiaceae bacterium]